MHDFILDFRHSLRLLARNPGFAATAVAALALGIGANTAVFSVVYGTLLRPLPYRDPDRLVFVWEHVKKFGLERNTPAPGNYAGWREQNRVFENLGAYAYGPFFDFTLTDDNPEHLEAALVTADLFPVLGVSPALGRNFLPDEDRAGARKVILISDALWRRRFAADPNIVGRSIAVNSEVHTVVGVMPPRFGYPLTQTNAWFPIRFSNADLQNRNSHFLHILARLKPGVTLKQASAEMSTIAQRLETDYPQTNSGIGAVVVPMKEQLSGDIRPALVVLLAAVGFVLLIACANVANLLLARATGRQREMAIRAALGAGRKRLVRQMLTESLALGIAGGTLGILAGAWGVELLLLLVPKTLLLGVVPTTVSGGVNGPVLLFSTAIAIASGILFGLAPALSISQLELSGSLKEGSRGAGAGAARLRIRNALVVTEVALALVLLAGAGLMTKSFVRLTGVDPGFDANHVLTATLSMRGAQYDKPEIRHAAYKELLRRVESIPGVESAGVINLLPLTLRGGSGAFHVEGTAEPNPGQEPLANQRTISPNYHRAMRIPLRAGRFIDDRDSATAPLVAVVNETMVRRYFPGGDALGKRIRMGRASRYSQWIQVVGITGDVRQYALDTDPNPEIYFSHQQYNFGRPRWLVVRSSTPPPGLAAAVRSEIRAVEPTEPVDNVQTLNAILGESVALPKIEMVLLGSFSFMAVALACIGIYGVMSYLVAQRTAEIGIRVALGATRGSVLRLVILQGARLVGIGVAAGLAASLGLASLLSKLLFQVKPSDPATAVSVSLLIAAVAMAACAVPAWRATRVDPINALRHE
ncbi:MAG: ABC transporter permease [Bryobacteraceae bacterium]